MLYYKLKDNIADEPFYKKIGYYCLLPIFSHARKKAAKNYPQIDKIIADMMIKQKELEDNKITSVDAACDPTATALSQIFAFLSTDETQKRILSHLGYLLGRYIYLSDALDDLEKDMKQHRYNVFTYTYENTHNIEPMIENVKGSLYMTIAESSKALDLLNTKRLKPILSNIVNLGLKCNTDKIISKKVKKA